MNGELTAEEFASKIKEGGYIVVDLRTEAERKEQGFIEGTTKFYDAYQADIQKKLMSLDKDAKYLLYCFAGGRSIAIYYSMELVGFKNVEQLKGGINAWKEAGYPIIALNY